jgi:hypothetical protein
MIAKQFILFSFEGTTLQLNIRLVIMAKRSHPFPCRTRKLSSSAPMVVGGSPPARVGRCQAKIVAKDLATIFILSRY